MNEHTKTLIIEAAYCVAIEVNPILDLGPFGKLQETHDGRECLDGLRNEVLEKIIREPDFQIDPAHAFQASPRTFLAGVAVNALVRWLVKHPPVA